MDDEGSIYLVYYKSLFITRLYCKDNETSSSQSPDLLENTVRESVKRHNNYHTHKLNIDLNRGSNDITIVKEEQKTSITPRLEIVLFYEFEYLSCIKNLFENLSYPKGLQISIKKEKVNKDVSCMGKDNTNIETIYKSNMKLFFKKENEDFAHEIARALVDGRFGDINTNISCTGLYPDRIIMECTRSRSALSYHERLGPLLKHSSVIRSEYNVFGDNCVIGVWSQFPFKQIFTDDVVLSRLTLQDRGPCKFDSVGEKVIHLRYRLKNGSISGQQESLERLRDYILGNITISYAKIVHLSSDWCYTTKFTSNGLKKKKYYLVVLEILIHKNNSRAIGNFRIEHQDELQNIIEEGLHLTQSRNLDLDEQQLEIGTYYAKEMSKIV